MLIDHHSNQTAYTEDSALKYVSLLYVVINLANHTLEAHSLSFTFLYFETPRCNIQH